MTSPRQATDKALADEREQARNVALGFINFYERFYGFNISHSEVAEDIKALQEEFKDRFQEALNLVYWNVGA
jgi:hypothetical protein